MRGHAARARQRPDPRQGLAQRLEIVGVGQGKPQAAAWSRYFSASSAAMQPVAALVTAWR